MDQEKIGKFIAYLRKEKDLTQQELADKLGVTDRAISKWENGRGMPDLSLIKELCDELNVSVNELLSGERLNNKEYQKHVEENIFNTIDYTNKKIKKTKKVFKIILIILFFIIFSLIMLFIIDIKRMNNNEPVFFSTWGYSYIPKIDLHEEEIEMAIKAYLINKYDNESKRYNYEKSFVSLRTYLIEEENNKTLYNIYAWVLEESYYNDNNEIKEASASSIPYKFVVQKKEGKYYVIDYEIPRDGSLYKVDMKKIFPNSVRFDMHKVHEDGTIEKLHLKIKEQVNLYYHID